MCHSNFYLLKELELEGDNIGGTATADVPMMLAACLLGDHDNIFFLRKNCSTRGVCPRSLQWIHEERRCVQDIP